MLQYCTSSDRNGGSANMHKLQIMHFQKISIVHAQKGLEIPGGRGGGGREGSVTPTNFKELG